MANALADRGTKEPLRPQMTRDVTHDLKCHLPGRPYTRFEFISPYRDASVNYEELMVERNAPRWLKMLGKYGYLARRPMD